MLALSPNPTSRFSVPRFAAMFWAGAVFFPVGVTYLAMLLLLVSVMVQGAIEPATIKARYARLRNHPMWWPLLFYIAWTLLVLATQPHYKETPVNLLHAARIAVTLALALTLTRDEAIAAVKGFLIGALISLAIIGLSYVGLPNTLAWNSMTHHAGNKSIAIAVLFSLIAASFIVVAMQKHSPLGLVSIPMAAITLSIAVWTIPSRTAVIIVLMTVVAAGVHQWRKNAKAIVGIFVVATVISVGIFLAVPKVQARFTQGITEIEQAEAGDVSENSWSVRFHMYKETTRMMLDRPVMGWGIGAWNQEWLKRTPPVLHTFNMPHNDYLWMGSQAGIPGALSLLVLFAAGLIGPWRRTDLTGRLAFVAGLTLIFTTSVHSANRDAAIGLSLLWIVAVYFRLAAEPGDAIESLRKSLLTPLTNKQVKKQVKQVDPITSPHAQKTPPEPS